MKTTEVLGSPGRGSTTHTLVTAALQAAGRPGLKRRIEMRPFKRLIAADRSTGNAVSFNALFGFGW